MGDPASISVDEPPSRKDAYFHVVTAIKKLISTRRLASTNEAKMAKAIYVHEDGDGWQVVFTSSAWPVDDESTLAADDSTHTVKEDDVEPQENLSLYSMSLSDACRFDLDHMGGGHYASPSGSILLSVESEHGEAGLSESIIKLIVSKHHHLRGDIFTRDHSARASCPVFSGKSMVGEEKIRALSGMVEFLNLRGAVSPDSSSHPTLCQMQA